MTSDGDTSIGKESIPSFPASHWFRLRKQFQKSIPKEVTPLYLATVLNMQENSAKDNILRPLKILGIVSQDNKTTELANRWRHDEDYEAVCRDLIQKIYPQELIDVFPLPGAEDKPRIKSWFSKSLEVGDGAAEKMASFYLLLCDADVSKSEEYSRSRRTTSKNGKTPNGPSKTNHSSKKQIPNSMPENKTAPEAKIDLQESPPLVGIPKSNDNRVYPSIHIDLQIHISPESSAEQIDAIFSSMAKYLNSKNES